MTERQEPTQNFVSEWFGHRVFPRVGESPSALADQSASRCPFLSAEMRAPTACVKPDNSKGICTISTLASGSRRDWLVCPKRALVPEVVDDAARRFFGAGEGTPLVIPGPALERADVRTDIATALAARRLVAVYLQAQVGGEVTFPRSDRSPEMSFDVTLVQLLARGGACALGRYGILEIQTMDFHGSYRAVANNLRDALRLHGEGFHGALGMNPAWLSERIEGPNISNVFKRTLYQMVFKFRLAQHRNCAGCVLAIPAAVWESWNRHLGSPELARREDGEFELRSPGVLVGARGPAWVYVFEPDRGSMASPNPIVVRQVINTDADAISHFAFHVAPDAAVAPGGPADGLPSSILLRLARWWPELAACELDGSGGSA